MLKQTSIPDGTDNYVQVSVFALIKVLFGQEQGQEILKFIAQHPGIDFNGAMPRKTYEHIKILQNAKT